MRKTYEKPIINLIEVKIEKGFAVSEGVEIGSYGYYEGGAYWNETENGDTGW